MIKDVTSALTDDPREVDSGDMLAGLDTHDRAAVEPAWTALRQWVAAFTAGPDASVEALLASRQLAAGSDNAVRASVARARSAGRTWAQIGSVLQTSRQAAFQRFGRTETTITPPDDRAGASALSILYALAAGDFRALRKDFDPTLTAALDEKGLARIWADVTSMVGGLERLGDPFARTVGEHTVVDVPMSFEAGEMVGRLAFDHDARTAGLFLLQPGALT